MKIKTIIAIAKQKYTTDDNINFYTAKKIQREWFNLNKNGLITEQFIVDNWLSQEKLSKGYEQSYESKWVRNNLNGNFAYNNVTDSF